MTKSLSFVASLLLLLLPLLVAAAEPKKPLAAGAVELEKALPRNAELAEKQGVIGCFELIKNISEPYYQNLGKYAVNEYNKKTKNHLRFQKVINGSFQIVVGTSYNLRLRALDRLVSRIYGAIIYKDLSQNLHLNDFFGITRN